MAQLAVMALFHLCVFAPYLALIGQRAQAKCLDLDLPILHLMQQLAAEPKSIDELPWRRLEGNPSLLPYMDSVERTGKTITLINKMIKPPGVDGDDLALFYKTSKAMVQALAKGTLHKMSSMFGSKYGDICNINMTATKNAQLSMLQHAG